MRYENYLQRSRLKGYMFEIVIKKLLMANGFIPVHPNQINIRMNRENFIEVKGRGCWHQADCLFDYEKDIPFLFPIRLIGEVKFYTSPIKKDEIRKFITSISDIQENYFAVDGVDLPISRVNDLGVFFSASGFNEEAERLAFVHNIKTVSYQNNVVIDEIKKIITEIELNYLSANQCLRRGNFNRFMSYFENLIFDEDLFEEFNFNNEFSASDGFDNIMHFLRDTVRRINSNFIAKTITDIFIHFISYSSFPDELFNDTDSALCEVYYNVENGKKYWLEFSGDERRRKFYFTPPENLSEAAFYGGNTVLNEKERHFKKMTISKNIGGVNRNLVINLNNTWLNSHRQR